jgi:alpha-L-fucosidase
VVPERPAGAGLGARHHEATYGPGFSYFDFRRQLEADATEVDLEEWAAFFARAGVRYVVMVTKHLDGYPLWPTDVRNPTMPADYRSSRDLVGDLTAEVRARGSAWVSTTRAASIGHSHCDRSGR